MECNNNMFLLFPKHLSLRLNLNLTYNISTENKKQQTNSPKTQKKSLF